MVLSLASAVALLAPLSFSSLLTRIYLFWSDLQWPYIYNFIVGCFFGVALGAVVFSQFSERGLMLMLGFLILFLIWFPISQEKAPKAKQFSVIGFFHSIVGTMFGIGGILQPILLRTPLLKGQITGTLAACLVSLDVLKIISYAQVGFDYTSYLPHILLASLAGLIGGLLGKKFADRVSEKQFRIVFKLLLTLMGLQLILSGIGKIKFL